MIKSMTGFGQVSFDDGQSQVHIEVKSLNSKFLDLNLRIPKEFSEKEMEVRNLISEVLERGKVSVAIDIDRIQNASIKQTYNEALFTAYYLELKKLADKVYAPYENIFELALNSPDVIKNTQEEQLSDETWQRIRQILTDCLKKCDKFRADEGKVLEDMLRNCILAIAKNLESIRLLDPKRVARIRERLRSNVNTFLGEEGFDLNRLEQEIIFYVEKLDINEEKVRLQSHLDYFLEVLREKQSNGKKLGFIAQEIGREINTIGSKSNDAEMQKHVVLMKEELEKIKEQLNNVV
ncbi:MAG TPA: YicC/YloC family endoribonuclease [Chryseosolibacter sp.]|nr:YicC/YloC family endoribonuclease [Chryseosolibacter sp.]